jgi:ATP-dependent Clp protease ATP-binding subunit ClpA
VSDHADIIRELLLDMGNGDTSPEEYDAALAALDRLVAAVEHCTEAEKPTMRPCVQRAMRLQTERDEALREVDFKKKALRNCREAHLTAEDRVAALEKALLALDNEIQMHNGSLDPESWVSLVGEIVRAALAPSATGGDS